MELVNIGIAMTLFEQFNEYLYSMNGLESKDLMNDSQLVLFVIPINHEAISLSFCLKGNLRICLIIESAKSVCPQALK
jgi:hypothetical protein